MNYASHHINPPVRFGRQQSKLLGRHKVVYCNLLTGPIFEGVAPFRLKPVDPFVEPFTYDHACIEKGIFGSWFELVVEFIRTEQGITFTPLGFRETHRTSVTTWYRGFLMPDFEVTVSSGRFLPDLTILQLIMFLGDDLYERYSSG